MNLIDLSVTEIISNPYFRYNYWLIDVKAVCYGRESLHSLMFKTKEECLNITIGHKFQE
jgi:hypothetical protein